jgi:hypothetical protein
LADKYITIAINSYTDVVSEERVATNSKGKETKTTVVKDGAKKLAARRTLMAKLYDKQEEKGKNEKKIQDVKTGIIYNSINEAVEQTGKGRATISRWLKRGDFIYV